VEEKLSLDPGIRGRQTSASANLIDDRPDNILAARLLGINDIVSREPVQLESESTRENIIEKDFTHLLILEATKSK
jgi:hypothetical protein